MTLSRKQHFVIAFTFAAAFLNELWHFLRISWFAVHYPPIEDSMFYMAVGRSLLNGLHLYRDMFESKPPIIFWLTELSLGTGHPTLYLWIQVGLLLSLAPALAFFVYRTTKGKVATACALLLGLTVAFETVVRTIAFQPEGFGTVLAVFSILLFAYPNRRPIVTVLSGVALGIAAMTKEPFVPATVLGMLVFCRSRKDFLRLALILCIGGAVSLLILALSGSLNSYFSIYLAEMLSGRSIGSILYPDFGHRLYFVISAPLWVRALNIYKLFTSMIIPVQSFLLPAFFILCLGLFPIINTHVRKSSLLFSFSLLMIVCVSTYKAFILYELVSVIHLLHMVVPWESSIILQLVCFTIVPTIAFIILWKIVFWKYQPSIETQIFTLLTVIGLFVVSMLVVYGYGGGDEYGQYMAFAMPFFVAIAMYCLIKTQQKVILGILLSLLIFNAFMHGKEQQKLESYSAKISIGHVWQRRANKLDTLMNSCGIQRYFVPEPTKNDEFIFAFTKHSPYQISYGIQRAKGGIAFGAALQTPNPFFANKFSQDLHNTQIVVTGANDDPAAPQVEANTNKVLPMDPQPNAPVSQLPAQVVSVLRDEFTLSPPACAKGLVPIDGIKVFFRH